MSIIDRLTPTHYRPLRIAFEPNGNGSIVAKADFRIYSVTGRRVGDDHPTVTLAQGQQVTLTQGEQLELEAGDPVVLVIDGPVTIVADGAVTLKSGMRNATLDWFNEQAALYENATGLEPYVPPEREEGPSE